MCGGECGKPSVDNMKKILFFLESLAGGGAEKVLTDIVCHLDKTKYDITVCTVTDGDVYEKRIAPICRYCSFLKTTDYRAGGIRKALFWAKLKLIYTLPSKVVYTHFFRERYDIEIAFIEGFASKIIAASSNRKSKKIAWVHIDLSQNSYADKYYSSLHEQRAAYKRFDRILCVSESVKKAFEQKIFTDASVCVQYNPVDEKYIRQQAEEPLSMQHPEIGLLLGTVGRLEWQKGYPRLLKCVKRLRDEGHRFTLWIIGKGSQQAELEQYVHENDLGDVVNLLGFHKNPYNYLNQCDVFICSSYTEGFSTAATESLILGKPVFTVECAGMQELIGNSHSGVIVPNIDEALYGLMEKLVSGQFDLAQYTQAAKKRGQDFSMGTRIAEIDGVLSSL